MERECGPTAGIVFVSPRTRDYDDSLNDTERPSIIKCSFQKSTRFDLTGVVIVRADNCLVCYMPAPMTGGGCSGGRGVGGSSSAESEELAAAEERQSWFSMKLGEKRLLQGES